MISIPTFITRAIVTVATAVVIDRIRQPKAIAAVAIDTNYVIVPNPNGNGTEVRIPILKVVGK